MNVQSKHRELPGARRLRDGHTLYWWAEVLAIIVFYLVYSAVRNSNKAGWEHALHNAERVVRWEQFFGLYHEETIQSWALHFKPLIIASNYFYGSFHFVVTIAAGVLLFLKFTDEYPRYRNMLAITTVVALVGFKLFPLMPPRLVDQYAAKDYPFVDTLAKYPTFWSFNSGAVSRISNQYAAMPSVHIAWAAWCTLVFAPRVRHRWARILAIAYPVVTLIVIVITANHWWLDAVGGLVLLTFGWYASGWLTRAGRAQPETAIDPA